MPMRGGPDLTVVIPTRDRGAVVERAVASALAQTGAGVEVVVVDDGSVVPVVLRPRSALRVVRRAVSGGVSAARNTGLAAAEGRWVAFLDDDNVLLPQMAEISLAAIARSQLPPPVAVLSGIEMVIGDRVVDRRLPPSHPRGEFFSLTPPPAGRSHMTKNTLVVDRDLLRELGGFDETLRTREMTDLLWRLNPVCSIEGVPIVAYRITRDRGPRVSRDSEALEQGLLRLAAKHCKLLAAHPTGHADMWLGHVRMSIVSGPRRAIVPGLTRAFRASPWHTASVLLDPRRMARAFVTRRSSG